MTTFLFIAIVFGWSVLVAILLKLLGIGVNSGLGPLVLAVFLMPSPAIATCVAHRFRWSEIVEEYGLNLRRLDLFLIVRSTIVFSVSFGLLYLVLVFLLGNALHLPGVGTLTLSPVEVKAELVRVVGASRAASANLPPVPVLYVLSLVAPIISGFTINGLFAFGEELGWRGFLWHRLRPYGFGGKILLGIVWGLWHVPIILLGFNFPGHPYLGILFMVLLTVSLTFPLTDLADRTGSVYTPSIIHGMINGSTAFSFIVIGASATVGSIVGIVGCGAILLAWIATRLTVRK
jgi:CAAX protease family protein